MSRRVLPLLTAALALALPVAPALAGEDDGGNGAVTLHAPAHGCTPGHRIKAWVAGDDIDHVAFYVNGRLIATDSVAGSSGRYRLSMSCSRLHLGANRARAVATLTEDSARITRRFTLTRLAQAGPRFTG